VGRRLDFADRGSGAAERLLKAAERDALTAFCLRFPDPLESGALKLERDQPKSDQTAAAARSSLYQ